MKKVLLTLVLLAASAGAARAQQANVVSATLGAQFFDTDAALETSPVLGVRWAWFARNGHGLEVTIDYTESRVEMGQLPLLLGLSFDDPQTVTGQLQRIAVDYGYVGRGGVVRPYVTAGAGYLRADLVLSRRAERILETLGRDIDTRESSATWEAGAGVLIGEERLRFRYDLRVIWIDHLYQNGGTAAFQTGGGISWVF